MKHPGHTYGGFIPAISERGMTHSGLFDLLTRAEDRSLRGRTITELLVGSLSSSALHLPLAHHNSSLIFKD
jgi:hypothetical protein